MSLRFNTRVLLPFILVLGAFVVAQLLHWESWATFIAVLGISCVFVGGHLLSPALVVRRRQQSTLDKEKEPELRELATLARERLALPPERIAIIKGRWHHSDSRGYIRLGCAIRLKESDNTEKRLKGVIAHELAHLARGDPLHALLADTLFSWLYVSCLLPLVLKLMGRDLQVHKSLLLAIGLDDDGFQVAGGSFHLTSCLIGVLMLVLVAMWQRHRHQRAEYLADKQAERLVGAEAMLSALPLDDGTRVFPFSSHPPSGDRRQAIAAGPFSTAVESRLQFVALIGASGTFFIGALLVVMLFIQVRDIRSLLAKIVAGLDAEKSGLTTVAALRGSLERGLVDAHTNLGLVLPDGGVQADGGLASLYSETALLAKDLHHSGTPLISGLAQAQDVLGIQMTGAIGTSGLVPSLKKSLQEFEQDLALARSEVGLGLPAPDGGFPAGGALDRVVQAVEFTRERIEAAPAYLGLDGDGGTADAGPLRRVAQSAQRLSDSLEKAEQVLLRLELTRGAGAATRCNVGVLTKSALELMSLEDRLDCIDQMSRKLALLQLERLRREEERARAEVVPPLDAGTGEGNTDPTREQVAPDGG
ncbi:M48 family metalloprotease [Cystobacter fuscus]|uniref:M48 family metalloprotease n=1 Tax=Cystobacter fuscus TaxID=43 RepID=UPI002B2BA29E|nr:M48 family metalloprotease [Cystobacter fuscus]